MKSTNNIDNELLTYEFLFISEITKLFDPNIKEFYEWLQTLPNVIANEYKRIGFDKSILTMDFQICYYNQILKLSFKDYLIFKGVTDKQLKRWKEIENERTEMKSMIRNDFMTQLRFIESWRNVNSAQSL